MAPKPISPYRVIRHAHLAGIYSLCYLSDASAVLTSAHEWHEGDGDMVGVVRCWDTHTGTRRWSLKNFNNTCWVAVSPDDRLLAWSGFEGRTRLHDLVTRQRLQTLVGHNPSVAELAFSPDGRWLAATGSGGAVDVWGLDETAEPALLPPSSGEAGVSLAFSPDGRTIAVGRIDGVLSLWDFQGEALATDLQAHQGHVSSLAFSPDGRLLATGSYEQSWKVWSLPTRSLVHPGQADVDNVVAVRFSPDGSLLAVGDGTGRVRLLETTTWKPRAVLRRSGSGGITGLCFSADGHFLAAGATEGGLYFYDVAQACAPPAAS
jgi:WD40 repeat protein